MVDAPIDEARDAGRAYTIRTKDFDVVDAKWPLRPEYVESLYVMWRLDPDAKDDAAGDSGGGHDACDPRPGRGRGAEVATRSAAPVGTWRLWTRRMSSTLPDL